VRSGRFVSHSVCLSVCLSVCRITAIVMNEPISLKLGDMIWPINQKNQLTFDGDPVVDTDSGLLSTSVFTFD